MNAVRYSLVFQVGVRVGITSIKSHLSMCIKKCENVSWPNKIPIIIVWLNLGPSPVRSTEFPTAIGYL